MTPSDVVQVGDQITVVVTESTESVAG
ncbi:hypothetical protein AB0M11_16695 [Streptomyces sp. NPDC051987]